tara:strand:+ start:27034 stop:27300 length:267 start_codon:yes stop_codon:yes gene_type:complete
MKIEDISFSSYSKVYKCINVSYGSGTSDYIYIITFNKCYKINTKSLKVNRAFTIRGAFNNSNYYKQLPEIKTFKQLKTLILTKNLQGG